MSEPPGTAVVIGGGIAGLASAALLARDGWQVEVLERRQTVGGRAGRWERSGYRFDTGPSWYLMPEVFDHFFALLGTSAEAELDLQRLDPAYRVFFESGDAPIDIPDGVAHTIALFDSLEPGAGARLESYLASARDTYEMAIQRFLYTSFDTPGSLLHPQILRQGPRLAQLLVRSLESHIARRFTDPRLRQVLGYPAVFLGSSPDRTPSMYHLMSWMDLADGVRYPRGGFTRLVAVVSRLAEEAGVRIRTDAKAVAITAADTGHRRLPGRRAPVTGVVHRDAAGQSHHVAADVVVAAADLHHVETTLLPRHLQTYPERWWQRRDPGPGAVLAYLGVRGALPELAHHSLFFSTDWARNFADIFGSRRRVPEPASLYVCRPSATDPTVAPPARENLFVLVPVPAEVALGRGGIEGSGDPGVERVADAAIEQVARWAGVPTLGGRVELRRTVGPRDFAEDLNAWSGGALGPGHTLMQSAFLRAGNVSRRVQGLYYTGSSTIPGIGLPMCLISAELVVKRVRGDRSNGPLPTDAGSGPSARTPVTHRECTE